MAISLGGPESPEEIGGISSRKRAFAKSLVGFVLYLAVVSAIAFAVPKVLSSALGTPYPMATITSQSMWPTMKRGDLVFVSRVAPEKLERGRIVVYRRGPSFIIHRVIRVGKTTVITQGDANPQADQPVKLSEIVGAIPTIRGRLIKIPYLGRLTFFVNDRPPAETID